MEITLQFFCGHHREQIEKGVLDLLPVVFGVVKQEYENHLERKIDLRIDYPREDLGSELLRISRLGKSNISVELAIPAPEIEEDEFEEKVGDRNWEGDDATLTWKTLTFLDDLIPKVFLAASISHPGVITLWDGEMTVGNIDMISSPVWYNSLIHDLEYGLNLGWPKPIEVTFEEAYRWTCKVLEPNKCASYDKVSRALAAFSHVAGKSSHSSNHLDLFWAMMGLESLYCEGEGIKKQLFDKACAIFGSLEQNKKKIRRMYDHRSALVHGSVNLPYSFSEDIPEETTDEFYDGIEQSQSIAFNLLISTLQYLVKHELFDLDFTYKLIKN